MIVEFTDEIWYWRGPAPFYFVTVPLKESREIKEIEPQVTYGWGMIPVNARIGKTEWYTALWAKDGQYVLPLKAVIRKAEGLEEGDTVAARIEIIYS